MDSELILREWGDWLVVFGYLGFTAFIIWRVLSS
jgi:hypothetical protein